MLSKKDIAGEVVSRESSSVKYVRPSLRKDQNHKKHQDSSQEDRRSISSSCFTYLLWFLSKLVQVLW
jgi:hypothetical protein